MASVAALWILAASLAGVVLVRRRREAGTVVRFLRSQGPVLLVRVPLAIVAAGFAAQLLPPGALEAALGAETGFVGVVAATFAGALMPGGPAIAFPFVVVLADGGAGDPQLAALVTAWSVFAVHRVLAFELPMLGRRFVVVRVAASLPLPLLVGSAALALS
jgi:hypothetical protein